MAKLRYLLLLLFFATLFIGCSKDSTQDIVGVINKYLDCSSKLQWEEVEQLLTGEALLETRANKDRVKNQESVLNKKVNVNDLTGEISTATVDVTKNNDRIAYRFHLIKEKNNWLIYKVEYGEYLYDELKPGQLPQGVEDQIKTYIELPKAQKDKRSNQFLAGPLLKASMRQLVFQGVSEEHIKITEKVLNIKCLGLAKDYILVEVVSVVSDGIDKNYTINAIYHLVDVNGIWKICRMDVIKLG